MIEIKNITKSFNKKVVLNNVSMKLPTTGIVILRGKSGCGKTTLLNILALEDKNYSGTILFDNKVLTNPLEFKKNNIFYNRYEDNLVLNLTVEENLRLFLNEEQYQKSLEYIDKYELYYLLDNNVNNISSGEYQKVCLIMALSKRAPITILDEPVGNIDMYSIKDFYDDLKEMVKEVLIIYVSHYEEDTDYLADYVYLFSELSFSIEKESQTFINKPLKENKMDVKLNKFLKMSKLWNKNNSKGKTIIFFTLFYFFIITILLNIYLLRFNKYDFYNYEIRNAPLGAIYFKDNINTNYDFIDDIVIKNIDNKNMLYVSWTFKHEDMTEFLTFPQTIHYPSGKRQNVKYLGICDKISVDGKVKELSKFDIIITDYIALNIDCSEGSIVEFQDYSFVVKDIINTGYNKDTINEEYFKEYEHFYNIVYVSNEFIDLKEELSCNNTFKTDTISYGEINVWIGKFDETLLDTNGRSTYMSKFQRTPLPPLNDNEFYCGTDYFDLFLENISEYEEDYEKLYDYLESCIGKTYLVTFEIDDYKFAKEMVFKGVLSATSYIVLPEKLYNEVREATGIYTIDYSFNTKEVAKNINNKTFPNEQYKSFFKSLNDRNDYFYLNKSLFDNIYNIFLNKNKTLFITLSIEILILILLGIIYYFAIYKVEFKNFRKLQTKGYSIKYYYIINYSSRVLVHIFITLILIIGFIFLMATLI